MGTRESIFHTAAQLHVRREGEPQVLAKAPRPEWVDGRWMVEITSIDAMTALIGRHVMFDLLARAAAQLAADPSDTRAFALSAEINECLKQVAPGA